METENLVENIMNAFRIRGCTFPLCFNESQFENHLESVIKYAKESVWVSVDDNEPKPINRLTIDAGNMVIDIQPDDIEHQPIYICHDFFKKNYFMARPYETLEGLSWCDLKGNRLCDINNVDYYMIIPKLPKK